MKNLALSLFLLFLLAPGGPAPARAAEPSAPPSVGPGSVLSLARCLEIADLSHPQVASAASAVSAQEARLGQARTAHRPQVTGSASYTRISPTVGKDADSYSAGITLTQNLYDFGRTRGQVAGAEASLDGAREDLADTRVRTALGVRQAYFGLLKATRSREVARENAAQAERRLSQAKGFFDAGTRPRYDVTKAEVDLANARLSLISSENAVRLALTRLASAMGVPGGVEFSVEDTLGAREAPLTQEEALARAMSSRSDLRSLDASIEASRQALAVADLGGWPSLDGRASYTRSGQQTPLDPSWSAGVTLTVPLYTAGNLGLKSAESRAALEGAMARREELRQAVQAEVQEAILNAAEAAERIPTAELAVRQAEENLALANGRYGAGVGSPIEVADAQTTLSNQKNAHIQALYDYQSALAALKKAMGER